MEWSGLLKSTVLGPKHTVEDKVIVLVDEFLSLLKEQDQKEDGTLYYPNVVFSCRDYDCERLNQILIELEVHIETIAEARLAALKEAAEEKKPTTPAPVEP